MCSVFCRRQTPRGVASPPRDWRGRSGRTKERETNGPDSVQLD
jgi:hypothetical protein